jgi:hypothetical protein
VSRLAGARGNDLWRNDWSGETHDCGFVSVPCRNDHDDFQLDSAHGNTYFNAAAAATFATATTGGASASPNGAS